MPKLAQGDRPWRGYNPQFKHRLAKEVLAARRSQESRLAIPPAVYEWACELAEEHIGAVHASGAHVVGDLAELRPSAAGDGSQPDEISDAELLETAVAALIGLARSVGKAQRARSKGPSAPVSPPPGGAWTRIRARAVRLLRRDLTTRKR